MEWVTSPSEPIPGDVQMPGFTEIDLVSYSGNSASGDFLHSLNVTDIHSTWVESRAVMGKARSGCLIDRFHGTYPPNYNKGTHLITGKGPTQFQLVPKDF